MQVVLEKEPFRASTLGQESLPALTSANESMHHPMPTWLHHGAYRQSMAAGYGRSLGCLLYNIATTVLYDFIFLRYPSLQGCFVLCSVLRPIISFRSSRWMVVSFRVVILRTIVRSSLPALLIQPRPIGWIT